jgi:hypothetical protein
MIEFLTVADALPPQRVGSLIQGFDRRVRAHDGPDAPQLAIGNILGWRGAMIELIDVPRITPYLDDLMGPPPDATADRGPFFRLDNTCTAVLRTHAPDAGA